MNQNAPTTLGAIIGLISSIGFLLVVFTDWTTDQDTAVLGFFAALGIFVGVLGGQIVQKIFTDPKATAGNPVLDERGLTEGQLALILVVVVVLVLAIFVF